MQDDSLDDGDESSLDLEPIGDPPPDVLVETETETETDEDERPGSSPSSAASKKKVKRKKCPVCNRKLTVVNQYECRCGLIFCVIHRYAESHECTFDYKEEGKRVLTLENPLIVASKLTKI